MTKKAILYVHGKGGSHLEAERYLENCPGFSVVGADYQGERPWEAGPQIRAAYDRLKEEAERVTLLANSIGAYFSMDALQNCEIEKALFISPILDMEELIAEMMGWAGVSEADLRERGTIPTSFGETLSWEYLSYVREHPISWKVPTEILYAGRDDLTPRRIVDRFVLTHSARLTVMEDGEHWFHTEKQLAFLDRWMKTALFH